MISIGATLLLCVPVYSQFVEGDLDDLDELDEKLRTPKLEVSEKAHTVLREIAKQGGARGKDASALLQRFEEDSINWATAAGVKQSLRPWETYVALKFKRLVSPQSFAYLYRQPNIRSLDILGSSVTDEHVVAISGFKKLGLLSLVSTSITGECLASLDLPNLQILNLVDSPVTDKAISNADFPSLVKLDLRGTRITGEALRTIRMMGIRELDIRNTSVTAADLRHLKRFTSLFKLTLDLDMLALSRVDDILAVPSLELLVIYDTGEDPSHLEKVKAKLGDRVQITVHPKKKVNVE